MKHKLRENAKMAGERSRRGLDLGGTWRPYQEAGIYQKDTWKPSWIRSRGVTPVSGCDLYLERSPLLLCTIGNNTAAKTS